MTQKCESCGHRKPDVCRGRQNTAYVDDEPNFAVLCGECQALLTLIVRRLECRIQCTCNEQLQPNKLTGHSLVCDIHKKATEHMKAGTMP